MRAAPHRRSVSTRRKLPARTEQAIAAKFASTKPLQEYLNYVGRRPAVRFRPVHKTLGKSVKPADRRRACRISLTIGSLAMLLGLGLGTCWGVFCGAQAEIRPPIQRHGMPWPALIHPDLRDRPES